MTDFSEFYEQEPKIKEYEIITRVSALKKLVSNLMLIEEFAFDFETNTLKVYGENKDALIVAMTISWGDYNNYYIPLNHRREEDIYKNIDNNIFKEYMEYVFDRNDLTLIGHNLKFDLHCLNRLGIEIATNNLFDTMAALWLCDEEHEKSLKAQASARLGIKATKFKEVITEIPNEIKKSFGLKANNKATFDLVLIEDGALYALADSFNTWKLYVGVQEELEREKMTKIMFNKYIPFLRVLFNMECRGVRVDLFKLKKAERDIKEDLERLEYDMIELAGVEFNPSSNQQKAEILFGFVKPNKADKSGKIKKANINHDILNFSFDFPCEYATTSGAPSTSGDTLYALSQKKYSNKRKREGIEVVKKLMEYATLEKINNSFISGLREKMYDSKIHATVNIVGTKSGRVSYRDPNLQQLKKAQEDDKYKVRDLYIANLDSKGKQKKILAFDYGNLEVRVIAHFSKDQNLIDAFNSGVDTHGRTAVSMFELKCEPNEVKKLYPELRHAAKTIQFMIAYGGSAFSLYNDLKENRDNPIDLNEKEYLLKYKAKDGKEVAQAYIDRYFDTYPKIREFIRNQKRFAHRNGYVQTILGRKKRLPDINSDDMSVRGYNERLAVNSTIQGSAGDITSSAQIRIEKNKRLQELECFQLIQIHDEIVFECPEENIKEAIPIIKDIMEHPFGQSVNLNLPLVVEYGMGDSYFEAK